MLRSVKGRTTIFSYRSLSTFTVHKCVSAISGFIKVHVEMRICMTCTLLRREGNAICEQKFEWSVRKIFILHRLYNFIKIHNSLNKRTPRTRNKRNTHIHSDPADPLGSPRNLGMPCGISRILQEGTTWFLSVFSSLQEERKWWRSIGADFWV